MPIKRILVPVDFSRFSLKALDYAIEIARPYKAEVVVIVVIEPMNYAVPRWLPEPTALLEEQRKLAALRLSQLEERIKPRYENCRTEVHFGVVYEMINEVAKGLKADLIVIATHGRTGLAHIVMGSVAERVVRGAPCPVLVIRSLKPPRPEAPRRKRRKSKAD